MGETVKNIVLYAPHLNRDLRPIVNGCLGDVEIFRGEKTLEGCDGCLQGHQKAVKLALVSDWPAIFVMEDDCQFTDQFDYLRWCETLIWARDHNYDIITGGCVATYGARIVNAPSESGPYGLFEVDKFHSAHCIIYLASSYEKVMLTVQPHDTSIADVGCRQLMTWPFVAVQRPGFSGILQEDRDYTPLYRMHEDWLEQAHQLRRPDVFSTVTG